MNKKIGDIIEVKVSGIENYGIFVNVEDSFNGLIHISEISDGFVRNINDYVGLDEVIDAKILDIDYEDKKVKLTIKGMNYRKNKAVSNINESLNGFQPLKENLKIWTDEKLKEIDE